MIIAGFAIYTYFSASIGILVGALSERSEIVEKLWSPISYISVPLSGVFYMVYWLPAQFRDIIKHFPMVTGVEMIRGGYFGPGIPVYYSVGSSLLITTVILLIGLIVLRNARRYVEMS
jgi:capsular polysaccharide transport system permease protein